MFIHRNSSPNYYTFESDLECCRCIWMPSLGAQSKLRLLRVIVLLFSLFREVFFCEVPTDIKKKLSRGQN